MTDAATAGVSENLMDTEVTNGAPDSATGASALLSRKGLFGKSGVLNQGLEASIAVEKEVLKPDNDNSNGDGHDEPNTSGSGTDALEIASSEDPKEEGEEEPSPVDGSGEDQAKTDSQSNVDPEHSGSAEVDKAETDKADEDDSARDSEGDTLKDESGNKEDAMAEGKQHEDHAEDKAEEDGNNEAETGDNDQVADKTVEGGSGYESEAHNSEPHDGSGEKVTEPVPIVEEPEPTKDNEPEAEPEQVVEEVCVKKIISMDTDDVDQNTITEEASATAADNGKPNDEMEITEITEITVGENEKERADEDAPVVEEPDSAESECMEEGEKDESVGKPEIEAIVIEEVECDTTEKADAATATEERTSSRRSAPVTPVAKKTPARGKASPAKKTPSRKRTDEEKADDEEKPETTEQLSDAKRENEDEDEAAIEPKSLRSRKRRSNVVETPKKEEQIPAKKRGGAARNAKKDVAAEAEDESEQDSAKEKEGEKTDDMDSEPTRCSLRSRAAKTPAKQESPAPKSATRRGRSAKKDEDTTEKKEAEAESRTEPETPRRGRKSVTSTPAATKTPKASKSSSAKKGKDEDHDPYDIETEIERHPEPLKNIQMEVQSFGEVKYAKTSSGKYERTEKTAESRVVNLAELAPRTKQRKSLADLTPGRKKASPNATTGSRTAPQSSRGKRKLKAESEEADKEEGPVEVEQTSDDQTSSKKAKKAAETPKTGGSARKRRTSQQTPLVPPKRPHVEIPQLSAEDLLAVDHPQDEHAAYEAGARVYAMFDGLFYPAVVVSRDGLGRYKVSFIEDGVVKDVPPAGVIPLRALDKDKECYFSDASQKDRLAVKVVKGPDAKRASAWQEAEFELEQLDDDGNSMGKKLKGVWTNLALSKEDWRDYINRKSREATDVIADNIESTEDRHLRRSKAASSSQPSTPSVAKSTPRSQKKEKAASMTPPKTKTPAKGGRRKKAEAATESSSKAEEADEGWYLVVSVVVEMISISSDASETADTSEEQIFAGKLFILTSANRPNIDTGFKKKFMTDFISSHGGLVVDDMKEVDEHPEMERFLVSDTHYRTHKYLAALVRAMPCVSHEWIYKCLNERKLVDYKSYLLPSGVSILDDREYPLPKQRGVLLRNKRVMVHSNVTPPSKKSMSFEQIWVPMVPQLGGEIVSEMPDEEGKLDILLTDNSATPSLVEKARKIGSAVVSSEWLIQGIIMDRLPDVNAHQKFLHNGGVCT
ncbi:BRCA1 protein [Ancylostoma caninum]|uniref:BRCA1 protein n=1 Tax=Ancylostoma caninum TaxID=29170 RepID=A0A368G432_ANCCA|nr:BRCA1 protein [Ancylostoma caninum]